MSVSKKISRHQGALCMGTLVGLRHGYDPVLSSLPPRPSHFSTSQYHHHSSAHTPHQHSLACSHHSTPPGTPHHTPSGCH